LGRSSIGHLPRAPGAAPGLSFTPYVTEQGGKPTACPAGCTDRFLMIVGQHTTDAPSSAKAFAVARPMPEPAPVTSATLFSKDKFIKSPLKRPRRQGENSFAVLLVADLIQPIHVLSIECFLNGNMRHYRRRRRAMPMFLARWKPHHVAGVYFLDRTSITLNPTHYRL
jgi:hypothetical protein